MKYRIMSLDDPIGKSPEYPIMAKTDESARVAAKKEASSLGIKDYYIIFYRSSDGCRGSIDK